MDKKDDRFDPILLPGDWQFSFFAPEPELKPPPKPGKKRYEWIPPGSVVEIAGRQIAGMVYTGAPPKVSNWDWYTVEPSLLDAALPVTPQNVAAAGTPIPYWSAYHMMDPETRGAYLDWLAAGRPAGANPRFPRLFLSGIERRILVDGLHYGEAREEIPVLLAEADRLQALYAPTGVDMTTGNLRLGAALLLGTSIPEAIDPPLEGDGWAMPGDLLAGLGWFIAQREPIPVEWALSWYICYPKTNLRTAYWRCPDEFHELFGYHYERLHGPGIQVTMPKRTLGKLSIRVANQSIGYATVSANQLPDPSQARKPINQLRQIAELVYAELDPWSRQLASATNFSSLATLMHYPANLPGITQFPAVAAFGKMLSGVIGDRPLVNLPVADLLAHFPGFGTPPTQGQLRNMARLVGRLGYGIEPDPATMRSNFVESDQVLLYRLNEPWTGDAPDLAVPRAAISLLLSVAAESGQVTAQHRATIRSTIQQIFSPSTADAVRLDMYLTWAADRPPSTRALRKRLEALSPTQTEQVALAVLELAGLRNGIASDRVTVASNAYRLLGLSEQQLHSDLHILSTRSGSHLPDTAPPTRATKRGSKPVMALDRQRIRAVHRETADITNILGAVFDEEKREGPETQTRSDAPDLVTNDPYELALRQITARPHWPLADLDTMFRALGLMPSGAIEALNDRAVALGLDPLFECDDNTCDVDESTLNGLLTRG